MIEKTPLRIRRLRDQLAAIHQYVSDLYMPIEEEFRSAPKIVSGCFTELLSTLDEFDRHLAKIDSQTGAVGGAVVLREEWREAAS